MGRFGASFPEQRHGPPRGDRLLDQKLRELRGARFVHRCAVTVHDAADFDRQQLEGGFAQRAQGRREVFFRGVGHTLSVSALEVTKKKPRTGRDHSRRLMLSVGRLPGAASTTTRAALPSRTLGSRHQGA